MVASVVAFPGEWGEVRERETGWMLCDGRPLKSSEYPELFEKIGKAHGDGTVGRDLAAKVEGYDFNLPDYRGYYLRGVDGGSNRDDEVDSRVALRPGGR